MRARFHIFFSDSWVRIPLKPLLPSLQVWILCSISQLPIYNSWLTRYKCSDIQKKITNIFPWETFELFSVIYPSKWNFFPLIVQKCRKWAALFLQITVNIVCSMNTKFSNTNAIYLATQIVQKKVHIKINTYLMYNILINIITASCSLNILK